MIHHVYKALCAHYPKSKLLPSPLLTPFILCCSPTSFPIDIHHTIICVAEFCVFVVLFISLFSVLYLALVKLSGSWLFSSDLSHLPWYSQDPSMLLHCSAIRKDEILPSVLTILTRTSHRNHLKSFLSKMHRPKTSLLRIQIY